MNNFPCIFTSKINKGLLCPFCHNVFIEPVLATGCGHSFCKQCTEDQECCPKDSKNIGQTIINISLSDQISQLEIHCQYGCKYISEKNCYEVDSDGCPEIIKLGERENHESCCDFSFVQCPRNAQCKNVRKKDLDIHLEFCQKVACVHAKFGCKFKGVFQELEDHLKECNYESLKDYIVNSESRLEKLQFELDTSKQEVTYLKSQLDNLIIKNDSSQLLERNVGEIQKTMDSIKEENSILRDHLADLNEFVNVLARQYEAMILQQNFRCLGTFVGHQGPVWTMVANGDLLFTGSSDHTIKVWDLSSEFMCIKTLEGHTDNVLCLCISDKRLFSGGKDNIIGEWNLIDLTNVQFIKNAHPKHYICALVSNDIFLISGSQGSIKIWDIKQLNRGAIHEISNFSNWVRSLLIKDLELYASSKKISVYSLKNLMLPNKTGILNKTIPTQNGPTTDCELIAELECPKPDSHVHSMVFMDRNLVCGTSSGDIYIWDNVSRTLINTLPGHLDPINSLACFLVNGVWKVFSASSDRTIRVWRLDHMTCTQILARHQGSVQSILFWKSRLFSAALDTSIKVWVAGS